MPKTTAQEKPPLHLHWGLVRLNLVVFGSEAARNPLDVAAAQTDIVQFAI